LFYSLGGFLLGLYNFNIRIQSFPDMYVASRLKYKSQQMFEVSAEDKKDVKIEF